MDGVTLPAGRPGRPSSGRPAGWRWPGVAGLLREPFRRRAWAECGYAIAHFETSDTSANRFHDTGHLITWHQRYFRSVPILSGQHDQVCRTHSSGADPHAQLPWTGRLNRQVNDLKSFRSAWLHQHHCAIGCRHACTLLARTRCHAW